MTPPMQPKLANSKSLPEQHRPSPLQDNLINVYPSVNIAMDFHGEVRMDHYVDGMIESLSRICQQNGCEYIPNKLAERIVEDHATVFANLKYHDGMRSQQIQKVKKYNGKMYTVTGTIPESIQNEKLVLSDKVDIIKAVSVFGKED